MDISDFSLAYLAGFLDGAGEIYIITDDTDPQVAPKEVLTLKVDFDWCRDFLTLMKAFLDKRYARSMGQIVIDPKAGKATYVLYVSREDKRGKKFFTDVGLFLIRRKHYFMGVVDKFFGGPNQ